jgi:signal transduction histidine kinase
MRSTYPGFGYWTAASALTAFGLFIITTRPSTFIWTNLLFVIARILTVEGNRAFRGLSARLWWIYLAGGAAYISAAHFEHVHNTNARILSMSSFDALAGFVSAAVLLMNPPRGRKVGLRFTGGMFLLYAVIYVARVVYFGSIPRLSAALYMPSTPIGTALSLSGPVVFLCCWVGWVVMNYERLLVDLREQKTKAHAMAKRAAAADAAKSELLAVVGHEIRNPLSAVLNFTDLMLDSDLNAEQTQYANGVRSSLQALVRVTDDVLDLSRIESGKLTILSSEFDLCNVLEGIAKVYTPAAVRKGLELRIDYDPEMPHRFVGDAERIRQVITNLVGNAVKFTSVGGIRIGAFRTPAVVNGSFRISVTDTGIGIPTENIRTLFEQCSPAHQSTAQTYGGNGIGLAISKKLTEMMGGSLGAKSEKGKGSTFWVDLALPVAQ